MTRILRMVPLAVLGITLVAAAPVQAALIVDGTLTLNTDPALAEIFQQTEVSPCVIGPPNCQNGAFPLTDAGSGGGGSTFDRTSPTYTVATITGLTGSNSFTMGLDFNQASDGQTLNVLEAIYYIGAVELSRQTFDIATLLQVNNNGEGFSDFIMTGFVIPALATNVVFHANWFNNDGADRFFLRGATPVPCTPEDCPDLVPEPALLAMLGMGMLGAGFVRRRARKS